LPVSRIVVAIPASLRFASLHGIVAARVVVSQWRQNTAGPCGLEIVMTGNFGP